MKPINFINAPSPAAHRALARFIRHIVMASITLMTILVSINMYQLHQIEQLKQDCSVLTTQVQRFKPVIEQQEKLAATEQTLRTQLNRATALRAQHPCPHAHVQQLYQCIPTACALRTISLQATMVTCTLHCKQPRDAHTYMQALTTGKLFTHASITEIRSMANGYQVTVELNVQIT